MPHTFGVKVGSIEKPKTPQYIKNLALRVEKWNSDAELVRLARQVAKDTEHLAVEHLKLEKRDWPELEPEEGEGEVEEEKDLSTMLKNLAARVHLGTATDKNFMLASYRADKLMKEAEFTTLEEEEEEEQEAAETQDECDSGDM